MVCLLHHSALADFSKEEDVSMIQKPSNVSFSGIVSSSSLCLTKGECDCVVMRLIYLRPLHSPPVSPITNRTTVTVCGSAVHISNGNEENLADMFDSSLSFVGEESIDSTVEETLMEGQIPIIIGNSVQQILCLFINYLGSKFPHQPPRRFVDLADSTIVRQLFTDSETYVTPLPVPPVIPAVRTNNGQQPFIEFHKDFCNSPTTIKLP